MNRPKIVDQGTKTVNICYMMLYVQLFFSLYPVLKTNKGVHIWR